MNEIKMNIGELTSISVSRPILNHGFRGKTTATVTFEVSDPKKIKELYDTMEMLYKTNQIKQAMDGLGIPTS